MDRVSSIDGIDSIQVQPCHPTRTNFLPICIFNAYNHSPSPTSCPARSRNHQFAHYHLQIYRFTLPRTNPSSDDERVSDKQGEEGKTVLWSGIEVEKLSRRRKMDRKSSRGDVLFETIPSKL